MSKRLRWSRLVGALALVILGGLSGTTYAATTGKIAGRVVDQNGTPLPGVAVVIEGLPLGATTGADGLYFILQVPPGTHVVEANLIGYQPIRASNVVVNIDRSTDVSFQLEESAIEVDALTVIAERPVVKLDVTSSQVSISAEDANVLPVTSLLEAVAFQAGIEVQNAMTISVRGSNPDEVSYMVDGFERTNPVENRSYASMNKELVQEVQILTGAFTAEYFARAAVVNVVTRDPGVKPSLSGDVSWAPAQMKHFGPGAYDDDEFDRLLYRSMTDTDTRQKDLRFYSDDGSETGSPIINSNNAVYYSRTDEDTKGEMAFMGWNELLSQINAGTYSSSDPAINANAGNWTKEALIEYWDYQHRPIAYGKDGDDDYTVDLAFSSLLPGLPNTGIVLGFHDVRGAFAVPATVPNFTDRKYEATIKSSPISGVKIQGTMFIEEVKGAMEGLGVTNEGNVGAHDAQLFLSTFQGSNRGTLLYNTYLNSHNDLGEGGAANKYYVDGNVPYEENIWGLNLSVTHSPMPSLYYTVSYNHMHGKTDGRHQWDGYRDVDLTHELTNRGADGSTIIVPKDAPTGFYPSEGSDWGGYADLYGSYLFTGGGYVTDFTEWSFDRFRLDVFHQVNQNHGVKAGAVLVLNNIDKDIRRFSRSFGRLGDFSGIYEVEPWQAGFYIQDKMEYEGLVVNAGLRLDGYNSGADVLFPNDVVPMELSKGGLVQWLTDAGIPVYADNYVRNLRWQYASLDEWEEYQLNKSALAIMPSEPAKTYWKLAPRLGIGHPVGTSTKFFFNFGWTYSLPKGGWCYGMASESFLMTSASSEARGMSNPNLTMPRSVQYEVGFERSIGNNYLFLVKGYSKDDDNMPGAYRGYGYDPATQNSHGMSLAANNAFATNRGMEITASKRQGRFWTGSFNLDFRVTSSGKKGYETVYDEKMNRANAPFKITSGQSQMEPSVDAMLAFHSPNDYGMLMGDWHLSIRQQWNRGGKFNYDPTGSGIPVELRWVDYWRTDLGLTKNLNLGQRQVSFYMNVTNLLNNKRLNVAALEQKEGGRYEDYMDMLVELNQTTGLYEAKEKVGDSKFDDIAKSRIVRDNDWLLYTQQPRYFQFGMRINL